MLTPCSVVDDRQQVVGGDVGVVDAVQRDLGGRVNGGEHIFADI
jgi:hypothetical protein